MYDYVFFRNDLPSQHRPRQKQKRGWKNAFRSRFWIFDDFWASAWLVTPVGINARTHTHRYIYINIHTFTYWYTHTSIYIYIDITMVDFIFCDDPLMDFSSTCSFGRWRLDPWSMLQLIVSWPKVRPENFTWRNSGRSPEDALNS